MTDERLSEIIGIVKELARVHVLTLPVDIEKMCRLYGARMTTLEDAEAMGINRSTLLECMGNRDGVATRGKKVWGIIYDKNAPINRLRFTLAEELMHTILGHTLDERFDALDPSYSEEVYRRYEEEAKVAADLLLISPFVYYRFRRTLGVKNLAKLFAVSVACLQTAARFYDERERVIRRSWGSVQPMMEMVSEWAKQYKKKPHGITVQMD